MKGSRPYKIVKKDTGEVVGSSMTMKAAKGSIAHRMDAETMTGKTGKKMMVLVKAKKKKLKVKKK